MRKGAAAGSGEAADVATLVDAARGGDRGALDSLVRLTYAETYTLAYRLTGHVDDAHDVVQEAYLRAWKGMRRFRGDAQFSTWLYRITANCAATLLAKRSRSRTEPLDEDAPLADARPEHDPELRVVADDERLGVAGALALLPWRLRQVIVLRDIYDLSHGSIARELGITEAAAKVRVHRARRRMREILSARRDEAAPPGEAGRGGAAARENGPARESAAARESGPLSEPRPVRIRRDRVVVEGEAEGGGVSARAS